MIVLFVVTVTGFSRIVSKFSISQLGEQLQRIGESINPCFTSGQ
jgi:hypothetical protein